jgi:hypothetical protein
MPCLGKRIYCSDISMMLNYMARTMCKADYHTQKKSYVCSKHQSLLYDCNLCKEKSKKRKFAYECKACHKFFCLVHFTKHAQVFKECKRHKLDITCKTDLIKITPSFLEFLKKVNFHQIATNLDIASVPLKLAMGTTKYNASIIIPFMKEKKVKELSKCSKRFVWWEYRK